MESTIKIHHLSSVQSGDVLLLYVLYISDFTLVATVTKDSGICNYVAVLWKADKLGLKKWEKNELLLHYQNKTLTFILVNGNAANGINQMQSLQKRSSPFGPAGHNICMQSC